VDKYEVNDNQSISSQYIKDFIVFKKNETPSSTANINNFTGKSLSKKINFKKKSKIFDESAVSKVSNN
jgi:hypothetical protein